MRRKIFEAMPYRSNRPFVKLFYSSPVATIITRPEDGKILDANESFYLLSEYSKGELQGKTTIELKLWTDPSARKEFIREMTEKKVVRNLNLVMRAKTGSVKNVLVSAELIEMDGVISLITFLNDLTAQKNAEASLNELNSILEHKIKQRTAELKKNNRLLAHEIKEKSKLEKKLRTKISDLDTFIYKISHDMKAPHDTLEGLINLAKTEMKDTALKPICSMLEKTNKTYGNILNDLVQIAETGQLEIKPQVIDIGQLLKQVVNPLANLPGFGDTRIISDIRNRIPFSSDYNLLTRIFTHLLQNAVLYRRTADDSFVNTEIRIFKNHMTAMVSDNGIGIPAALQDKVFNLFFRANDHVPGTGLGLYIVRNALEKLDGTIVLKSETGKGTVFTVKIPNLYRAP